jgi:hypothetical protein
MKKISITFIVSCVATAAEAQENFDPFRDREFYFDTLHICAILATIYLISSFILQLFRSGMSSRIKNRMLDKGTDENIVRELLKPEKKENRNYILQWFFMMAAIGIGLLLVKLTSPIGLHSVAILVLSLAAGFGSYYYFSRQTEKLD